jgi:hypothetical protein
MKDPRMSPRSTIASLFAALAATMSCPFARAQLYPSVEGRHTISSGLFLRNMADGTGPELTISSSVPTLNRHLVIRLQGNVAREVLSALGSPHRVVYNKSLDVGVALQVDHPESSSFDEDVRTGLDVGLIVEDQEDFRVMLLRFSAPIINTHFSSTSGSTGYFNASVLLGALPHPAVDEVVSDNRFTSRDRAVVEKFNKAGFWGGHLRFGGSGFKERLFVDASLNALVGYVDSMEQTPEVLNRETNRWETDLLYSSGGEQRLGWGRVTVGTKVNKDYSLWISNRYNKTKFRFGRYHDVANPRNDRVELSKNTSRNVLSIGVTRTFGRR